MAINPKGKNATPTAGKTTTPKIIPTIEVPSHCDDTCNISIYLVLPPIVPYPVLLVVILAFVATAGN